MIVNWLLALGMLAAVVHSSACSRPEARPSRGLWVWESSPLLHDTRERRGFLGFCERHGIEVVGIQIATVGTGVDRRLDSAAEWRALLAEARRRGLRLHALDGDPQYALRAMHETVLSIVDAVIAYNASVVPAERFYGIHLDIEPYLLQEWKEPRLREQLLSDYLELNERATERSRAAGLVYGVDIPYWWQATDSATGEAVSMTTFRGVRKPATDHLLELVDIVGIMAYRNVAAGSDGIITHALDTIERADRIAKARTFVGVETEKISEGVPAKATFAGKSLEEVTTAAGAVDTTFVGRPSYAGIAIHRYVTFRQLADRPP